MGSVWLFGLWLIFVLGLASVFRDSPAFVLHIVAVAFGAAYLIGLFPALKKYSPSYLLESASLLAGASKCWNEWETYALKDSSY